MAEPASPRVLFASDQSIGKASSRTHVAGPGSLHDFGEARGD